MNKLHIFLIIYLIVFILISMFRNEHFYQYLGKQLFLSDPNSGKIDFPFYPIGTFSECKEYCKSIHPGRKFSFNSNWKALIDKECNRACSGQIGGSTKPTTAISGLIPIDLKFSKVIEDNVRKIIVRWKNITDCKTKTQGYYALYYFDSNLRNIDKMNVKYIDCGTNQIKFMIKDGYTEYQQKDELFLDKNKKYTFQLFKVDKNFKEYAKNNKLIDNEIEIIV